MRAAIRAGQRFASRGILRVGRICEVGTALASSGPQEAAVGPGGRTALRSFCPQQGLRRRASPGPRATVVCEGKGSVKEQFKADSTGKEATGRTYDEYLPDHGPSPKNWKSWKNPQPPNIELYAETRLRTRKSSPSTR